MKPFISLCMIVKNEEKVLKRCLESVDEVIDEIIIIDTGSTDNTKKIAAEFNTIIYDFEWNNNFATARNFAQSKATGTWILFLDADEYVDTQNLKDTIVKLKELDTIQSFDAYVVTQINFAGNYGEIVNPCLTIRIYKNDPSIEFHRSIHEQLYKKNGELSIGLLNFNFYHSGYLNKVHKKKNKTVRNVSLLIKELENNENAFDYFNMGNEYGVEGRIEEALESYKKAYLQKKNADQIWVPNAVERIIYCLLKLERHDEAIQVAEDASIYWNNIADFKCLKGQIYVSQNRYEDAEGVLLELILNKNNYTACQSINYLEYFPYKILGEIYEERNEIENAVKYYSYALNFNDKDMYIMKKLYNLLLEYNNKKNVITFVHHQESMNNIVNRFLLLKVLLEIGDAELVEYFMGKWELKCSVGLLFKLHLLKGEYHKAYNLLNQISIEVLLSEGWSDINDVSILALQLENEHFNSKLTKSLPGGYEWLNILFNDIEVKDLNFAKIQIINLLQKCIQYRKLELFEKIIYRISFLSMNIDIGNLLYKNGFKNLALDFYQENDLSKLDAQALVNIIESLLEQKNNDDALRFAYVAIEQNKLDYRIFKMAIEILNKMEIYDDKEKLIEIALQYYPESEYIKRMKDGFVLSIIE